MMLSLSKNLKWRGIGGTKPLSILAGTLPGLILIGVFIGLPIIGAIRLSMSRWPGIGDPKWIGLKNFSDVLTDPATWHSIWVTVLYSAVSSILIVAIATLLAAAVNANLRGSPFFKVVWFLPGMAPAAAVAIFWSNAFQPERGAINIFLGALGLGDQHAWLAQAETALIPIIIVTVWTSVGFAFLILLGAMQQIPVNLFEASRMDGAGPKHQFFTITLPLIRPTLVIITVLEMIWAFNNFTVTWAMTQGGPGGATSILPVLVYKEAFQFTNFGAASALAVIGGGFLMVLGMVGLRLGRSGQQR